MKKIYVGNLQFSTTEADLRAMFDPFGAVESATLVTDRDTGRSRGFGFVEMAEADADNAIKSLNGKDSGGRALIVNEARPKTERSGGGGFRGGRGGGGGGRDDYRGHARQPREPRW